VAAAGAADADVNMREISESGRNGRARPALSFTVRIHPLPGFPLPLGHQAALKLKKGPRGGGPLIDGNFQ